MIEEKPFEDSQFGRPHRYQGPRDIGVISSGGRSDDAARTGIRGFLYKGKLYKVYSNPYDTPTDILNYIGADVLDNKQYKFVFLQGQKNLAFVQPLMDGNVVPQVEIVEE